MTTTACDQNSSRRRDEQSVLFGVCFSYALELFFFLLSNQLKISPNAVQLGDYSQGRRMKKTMDGRRCFVLLWSERKPDG
jgi:hypothetical protein